MAKGVFERKKPHMNVGTIVTLIMVKTTLTAAIATTLALKVSLKLNDLMKSTKHRRKSTWYYYCYFTH